jgi:hypothetical protein
MRKQIVAVAMAASVVTGAGAGALLFVPGGANAASTAASTAADTRPARGQWVTDAMKKLVDAGTITQAQADAVVAALEAARPADGPDGPGGPGFKRGGGPIEPGVAATALGLTPEQLRAELTADKSLADVAAAHGVDEQKVIDALVAAAEKRLAAAVTAGKLTQAEADARKADLPAHVKEMVEHARPPLGERDPRGMGAEGTATAS